MRPCSEILWCLFLVPMQLLSRYLFKPYLLSLKVLFQLKLHEKASDFRPTYVASSYANQLQPWLMHVIGKRRVNYRQNPAGQTSLRTWYLRSLAPVHLCSSYWAVTGCSLSVVPFWRHHKTGKHFKQEFWREAGCGHEVTIRVSKGEQGKQQCKTRIAKQGGKLR